MKSMTGFAEHQFSVNGQLFYCEIKSLNGRFLTLNFNLPDSLTMLEEQINRAVQALIQRGAFYLKLVPVGGISHDKLKYDYNSVAENVNTLQNFANLTNLQQLSLSDLLQLFNPFKIEQQLHLSSEDQKGIIKEMIYMIHQLVDYRNREGIEIQKDLIKRITITTDIVVKIEAQLNTLEGRIETTLKERLNQLLQEVDQGRLEQEIVYYVNKYDFSEEVTRLQGHIKLFQESLVEQNPIGRRLDFILQEMNREANTIGSKARFPEVSPLVIALKEEIEKMKEQVQNVE